MTRIFSPAQWLVVLVVALFAITLYAVVMGIELNPRFDIPWRKVTTPEWYA